MKHFTRLVFITLTLLRFGVDEIALGRVRKPWLRAFARVIAIGRSYEEPRGPRLRQALERLGPIFIKFGQVLSTRRDLLPADIADELAMLQDRVPPFDGATARGLVESGLLKGALPPMSIDGDGALAADVNWIAQNVRWDPAADAERFFGPFVGEGVSRAGAGLAQAAEAARGAFAQMFDTLQSRKR